jgi:hypothetical protein
LLDAFFLLAFAYQGFLTFSRGGMLVSILAVVVYFLLSSSKNGRWNRNYFTSYLFYFLVGLTCIFLIFNKVNEISGGKLFLRYQGETEGTFRGTQEKTLSKMTSGRNDLIADDFELFKQYPLTGVGAGSSRYMRAKMGFGIAPHIEFSRAFAEHGILGIVYFLMLTYLGWLIWHAKINKDIRNVLFVLYLIGFLSSFHSAMRTFVTPLLIGLSSMIGKK